MDSIYKITINTIRIGIITTKIITKAVHLSAPFSCPGLVCGDFVFG